MKFLIAVLTVVLAPMQAFAAPSASRLAEIQNVAAEFSKSTIFKGIKLQKNNELQGPAVSYIIDGKAVIQYSPTIFKMLSKAGQDFILYHEAGHIHLGHVLDRYPGAAAAQSRELEADAFAALVYRKFGRSSSKLTSFLDLIETMTDTQPSGPERVKLIESLLP